MRQETPSTPAANDVEDGVEDLAQGVYPRVTGVGVGGEVRLRHARSTSERSVGYALLIMLGTLPSHHPKPPFRTVSLGSSVNRGNGDELTRAPLWTDETGPSNIGIV